MIDQGLCPNMDICGRVIDESDSEISKQAKKQDKKPFGHIGLRKVYVTGCHRGVLHDVRPLQLFVRCIACSIVRIT